MSSRRKPLPPLPPFDEESEFTRVYSSPAGELTRFGMPPAEMRWKLNLILFVLTFITTTVWGTIYANESLNLSPWFFLRGLWYSIPLMTILSAHEMGHFLAGRRHGLNATLPYFLPGLWPAGTFGAFIRIRSIVTNRRVLMEIGAAGPVAGAMVSIPFLMVGIALSEVQPSPSPSSVGALSFGSSIVVELICWLWVGNFSSSVNLILHPMAVAAWFGLFVTAMNLLPVGQLDGGHVVYALFGPKWAFRASLATLLGMGVLGMYWQGWWVFGILLLILGVRHPPPLDTDTPLDRRSRYLGYAALLIFAVTFMPVPLALIN